MKKYCLFNTTDRIGEPDIVDPRTVFYSNTITRNDYHYVIMTEYPQVFHVQVDDTGEVIRDQDGDELVAGIFMIGWENLPTWKYKDGVFTPYNPHESSGFKKWVRREQRIQPDITKEIKPGTELKHIRKALKAIINLVPGADDLESVQEFLALSQNIEKKISNYPKEQISEIDLYKENGVSKKRIEACNRKGVDFGPTLHDLRDDKVEEKNEMEIRRKIHAARVEKDRDYVTKEQF